jgi:glutaredoxin-like protein
MNQIVMYGASWCADCRRSKNFLDSKNIAYEFIDIDTVPGAADKVAEINDGRKSIPTILFPDGGVLVEPSNEELATYLARS